MIMPMLMVEDIKKSRDFYVEKLGFADGGSLDFADGSPMMAFVNLGSNSLMLGIDSELTSTRGAGVDIYLGLDDDTNIDTYYDQVKSNGASIATEIKDEFWGDRTFAVKDLDGFSLIFFKTLKEVSLESAQGMINTGEV